MTVHISPLFGYRSPGRRGEREALMARARTIVVEPDNEARRAPMRSRRERRQRARDLRIQFRPVYGYVGPSGEVK